MFMLLNCLPDHDDRPHDVVLEELEDRVEVEVVDKVPDALHHVLHRPLALTLCDIETGMSGLPCLTSEQRGRGQSALL